MTAAELFAKSQGAILEGDQRCYWCESPCSRSLLHNDPPLFIGEKHRHPVKCRQSPYQCVGCWLFARRRVTVRKVGGGFQDGQAAINHSWWITNEGAWVLNDDNKLALYEYLLDPPKRFVLALKESAQSNYLQSMVCNDPDEVLATTQLKFTIDGKVQTYTVNELDDAIEKNRKEQEEYPSPGVQALFRVLGVLPRRNGKRKVGRPRYDDRPEVKAHKILHASAASGG